MPKNLCAMLAIALCLIVISAPALAADDQPIVVDSISRFTDDAHLGQSWTMSVPTRSGNDAWIFTFDNRERWGCGYRTKLFGGADIKWQRFIVSADDLSRNWQLQAQTLAATKDYAGLLSLQFAEGKRPQLFTDPQVRLAGEGDVTLWLQAQYFGEWDDLLNDSNWRIGPELQAQLTSGLKAKFRCTFGSGDPQYQIWFVASLK